MSAKGITDRERAHLRFVETRLAIVAVRHVAREVMEAAERLERLSLRLGELSEAVEPARKPT